VVQDGLVTRMRTAANGLALDTATVQVVEQFREAGIPSILLKGPAIARWLYDDDLARVYGDIDLMVPAYAFSAAEHVLRSMGFVRGTDPANHQPRHAKTWRRLDNGVKLPIDLHHTLVGVSDTAAAVWETLSSETEPMRLAGKELNVLRPAARAVVVALHAAEHGAEIAQPLADLSRALERLPEEVWQAAAEIAERLGASPAFVTGLSLHPVGREYAGRLPPVEVSLAIALRARTPPPMTRGLLRFREARGVRARSVFVARELFPEAPFMRRWSPRLAQRGPLGLALAYCWRIPWLLLHGGPALFALWRARREAMRASATRPSEKV